MSTGDAAIDAAFSDAASSPPSGQTGDSAIDSAFGSHLSWGDRALGAGQLALTGVGNLLPSVGNAAIDLVSRATGQGTENNHVIPEFSPGKAGQELVGEIRNSDVYRKAAGALNSADRWVGENLGDTAQDVLHQVWHVAGDVANLVPALKGGRALLEAGATGTGRDAQSLLNQRALASPQSTSASAAAPNLANASPELQAAIAKAATKGPVNPDVLARHIEADSLPVRMQLSEGQATQDPTILSNEVNRRGKEPALAQRYNEQNGQLIQNVQALRDRVGPEVFSTNPVEHGETLIDAYKAKDAAAQAQIGQKYQALRDANGGQFPVDAQKLLDNASANLHQQLLFDHAPKAVMSTIGRLADQGNMTFQNFESLRTNLARIQRSLSADGNEKAAAGIIRNAMEDLPLSAGSSTMKPLADAARSAAKAQFDALDADPAYKAAVNDSVPPDRFVQKYVISAPKEDVATMRQNLAHDDTASQTMSVAALDHLRAKAGIDSQGNGNFSQANFNRHLEALSPKAGILFDPQTAEDLHTLGNVARYTQAQPRGSFVNNSNTFVAQAAEHAKSALEGAANVAAKGVPVGTWVRKAAQSHANAKEVQRALEPGAGLRSP